MVSPFFPVGIFSSFKRVALSFEYNRAAAAVGGDAASLGGREVKQMTLTDHLSEPRLRFLKKFDT